MLSREAPYRRRPAQPAARPLRTAAALAAAAAIVALPACGEGDDSTATTSPAPPPAAEGGTDVIVTLDVDGKGGEPPQQQVVTCPGGDKDVCDAIADLPPDPAAEVPPGSACTQIYGGPDTLVLQGRINGEPVDGRLSRGDGCEIERFDRFVPMLQALYPDYEPGAALGA